MKLLSVATKLPWPPNDGGRLVAQLTLEALARRGVDVHVIAPLAVPTRLEAVVPSAWLERVHLVSPQRLHGAASWRRVLRAEAPLAIARHLHPAMTEAVVALCRQQRIDVVLAEQLQALPQCAAARAAGWPVMLRCHNVESDLSHTMSGLRGTLARLEATRFAAYEGRALREADAVIAFTPADAERLRTLAREQRPPGAPRMDVEVIRAPFPDFLDPAETRLEGDPAVVILGSAWHINDDGVRWFLSQVWPRIRAALPGAMLHLFGRPVTGTHRWRQAASTRWHGELIDSRAAFAPTSVCVVPLRYASGVRMRILEAWARGIPVVATGTAVGGMEVRPGTEALVADTPEEMAAAVASLHAQPGLQAALVRSGRERLRELHDPAVIASQLIAACEQMPRTRREPYMAT